MSASENFRRLVDTHTGHLRLLLAFAIALAVLNLAAVLMAEQSTGAVVVSVIVFALLGAVALGAVALLTWADRD